MKQPNVTARMLAIKAVIDFFPSERLIAADVERMHSKAMVAGVRKELRYLRVELRRLLKERKSTNQTNHT